MECNIQRQALEVWITLHIREQVHIGSQDIYFQELGLLATNKQHHHNLENILLRSCSNLEQMEINSVQCQRLFSGIYS